MLVYVAFDEQREFEVEDLRCVVIGRDKGGNDPRHHVLVVHLSNAAEKGIYERVGVASLKPAQVGSEAWWVTIR
jgi:hypothetical protein